jgi:hypothetical protein
MCACFPSSLEEGAGIDEDEGPLEVEGRIELLPLEEEVGWLSGKLEGEEDGLLFSLEAIAPWEQAPSRVRGNINKNDALLFFMVFPFSFIYAAICH